MRNFDLSPLYRSAIGFDRLFNLLENNQSQSNGGYPPYNVELVDENNYRIAIAVAGFAESELEITDEYASQKHSISKELFFKRANSRLQDKIRNGDFKYGEKEILIDSSKQLLNEMDLAYQDISQYSSVEDFFYKITKNQFETEKFISDLSKKYNFPYEKNSIIAKFLTNNHDKFKSN